MRLIYIVMCMLVVLLMPTYASAQTPDRISVLESFGTTEKGESIFIFGKISNLDDESFLIMQIINPRGDLCQIQQLMPLPNGAFITDIVPLKGRICGISGEYEIKLFYGDYTKSTTFSLSPDAYPEINTAQRVELARELVSTHAQIISDVFEIDPPVTNQTSLGLNELEASYVDMLDEFFVEDLLIEIDPMIRPAVSSSLDSVIQMRGDDKISFEVAKSIDRVIFASVFHYEAGNKTKAVQLLTDAFIDIRNVNPEKNSHQRTPTFDELEETLLRLMKKSDTVMSKPVKSEIAFIFARGTAPVYAAEITELIDILSKSRYLDVISRKQTDLFRLVQNDWKALKPSLQAKVSVDELIESKTRVSDLHTAAILLRELDDVERFISSDSEENDRLANLLQPKWTELKNNLVLASSVNDILDAENQIYQMTQVTDISSRISKSIAISQSTNADSKLAADWEDLLQRVNTARSVEDVLEIVLEFDQSVNELREKRNPLTTLEFQYQSMKQKAQLQADYQNLFLINNALNIIETAKEMESGNPSAIRIDRIEVLLTWASEKASIIQNDLNSYSKDAFKIRASDILQRAKSIENLIDLSMTKNKFLPNYVEVAEAFNEKVDRVRDLVIQNDLEQADSLVRELFEDWQLVSDAYANDPYGSDVGYTVDELKRIELRKKLEAFSVMVSTFYNNEFASHAGEYRQMMAESNELIEISNFVDAETKITEIGNYLSRHMVLSSPSIIYDVAFDMEKELWVIRGTTEKSAFDRREDLYVTIYNMDGTTHDILEFTDTRQGNFYTQWEAPADPGLYVVLLQYRDSKATRIVHIEEEFMAHDKSDLGMVGLAREFDELVSFAEKFGGGNFDSNPRFASAIREIKSGLTNHDAKKVGDDLEDLKTIIERYLPVRSRAAVVEAHYEDSKLVISGAVQKTLAFREDLFVDIYDQRGNRIEEIALKDDSSGLFTKTILNPFDSGTYVVQLQYHDVAVTDFFNVR